jgi:uncharacterized membrane protein
MWVLKNILVPGLILLVLDGAFLSANARMFQLQVAEVQRVSLQMKPLGAIICYALLIFGLYYFILREHKSIKEAMLLGFVIYGIFESTNYALLKRWNMKTMVVDTIWGATLLGLTTYLTYKFNA